MKNSDPICYFQSVSEATNKKIIKIACELCYKDFLFRVSKYSYPSSICDDCFENHYQLVEHFYLCDGGVTESTYEYIRFLEE